MRKQLLKQSTMFFLAVLVLFSAAIALADDDYDDIDEKISGYTGEICSSFGDTLRDIQARLGKPAKTESKKEKNPHDPSIMDTYTTLTYEGIELALFIGGSDGSGSRVIWMKCTSKSHKLKHFNIGDKTDKVQKALGKPTEKGKGYIRYDSDYAILEIYHGADNTITGIEGAIFMD